MARNLGLLAIGALGVGGLVYMISRDASARSRDRRPESTQDILPPDLQELYQTCMSTQCTRAQCNLLITELNSLQPETEDEAILLQQAKNQASVVCAQFSTEGACCANCANGTGECAGKEDPQECPGGVCPLPNIGS